MSNRVKKSKRKTRRARERGELFEHFYAFFPGCKNLVYDRVDGVEGVVCLDCGHALFLDRKRELFSIGRVDILSDNRPAEKEAGQSVAL